MAVTYIPLSQLLGFTGRNLSTLYRWHSSGAWRKFRELTCGVAHDGGKTRERQSNRTHVERSRGRGYCYRRAGVNRARGRHNKRKPEVAADRFEQPRSVVDLEKAGSSCEALPRRPTRNTARLRGDHLWASYRRRRRETPTYLLSIDRSGYMPLGAHSVELVNDAPPFFHTAANFPPTLCFCKSLIYFPSTTYTVLRSNSGWNVTRPRESWLEYCDQRYSLSRTDKALPRSEERRCSQLQLCYIVIAVIQVIITSSFRLWLCCLANISIGFACHSEYVLQCFNRISLKTPFFLLFSKSKSK